ncbi:ATP-grasp domain-containing protein [Nocardia vinacea]|uniref:ATP-grasp domain-containing protein n=1 Tax=Nocardia vinacea TaxID=96468 RepID=UPI0002E690B0|nr:ATP-grasp domain-containing protein [Nocardia vinacea]
MFISENGYDSESPRPLIFAGHRLFDALSSHMVVPLLEAYCCDYGESAMNALAPEIHSIEENSRQRARWTSADIDQAVRLGIDRLRKYGGDIDILPYAVTSTCEELRQMGIIKQILGPEVIAREKFENKLKIKDLFAHLHLPVIPHSMLDSARGSVEILTGDSRYPMVIRSPYGSTGAMTFLIRTDRELNEWAAMTAPISPTWFVEPFVKGPSVNVNAIAGGGQVYIYPPSLQLTGVPECTDHRMGFCGNDFIQIDSVDLSAVNECLRQTGIIGMEMSRSGFRGCYGVDFIVDLEGTVYPCEINPRFQNSTFLLNFAFQDEPKYAPTALHCSIFRDNAPTNATGAVHLVASTHFAQAIIYASGDNGPIDVENAVHEGCYMQASTTSEASTLRTTDTNPNRLRNNEYLVAGSVPLPGTTVEGGAPVAKIVAKKSMGTPDGTALQPWARTVATALSRRLGVRSDG